MKFAKPISQKNIEDLLSSDEKLKIPPYQRRYSWEKEHFEDLWTDIEKLESGENHFFGTIVFRANTHVAQETNEIDIVDGQQRITSVSILLCAVRDHLKERYQENKIEQRLENLEKSLWLVDRDGEKEGLRLVLGNLDKGSYRNLIKSNRDEIENPKIKKAYNYFRKQLEKFEDLEEIKSFHDKVLDQLIYVSITAKDHTDAYHLFESMNNRGLSLSPIDLMKNYLLMTAAKTPGIEEKRVEELWGDIIKNIDDITGVNKSAITFFRQYVMSSRKYGVNEKITKKRLYEPTFEKIIDDSGNLEDLLKDLKKQSKLFKKMLTQNIDEFSESENSELNRLLRDAETVSITPFTLFLRSFRELSSVKDIKEVIRVCNSLMVRRQVCDRSTAPHDTMFNHLARNAFEKEDPVQYIKDYLGSEDRFPGDEPFQRYFQRESFSRNDRTKYILGKIEENHFGNGGKEVVESRYQVHIEHILPETYGKNLARLWLKPNNITKDQHDEFKKRIGNLTLLEESPNIRASNRDLSKKQEYYTEDKTDFLMTQELTTYQNWSIDEIRERSKILADIATKVWKL